MKFLILLCCAVVTVSALKNQEWESFKNKYGRRFRNPTEETHRKRIFFQNKAIIEQHNLEYAQGRSTFFMGINQFADMTNEEYKETLQNIPKTSKIGNKKHALSKVGDNPSSVDYRTSGCVGPVQNQGSCGSSAEFSVLGTTEYADCKATGTLNIINPTALGQCCAAGGFIVGTCNGGFESSYYDCIVAKGGSAASDASCENIGSLSSYADVTPSGNETALETAVANVGVIAAEIDASQVTFQLYVGGVYDDPNCSSTQLDHSVSIVGYGTDGGIAYWLVENSWGTSWGMKGYIEMAKGKDNQCGIATAATYGIY